MDTPETEVPSLAVLDHLDTCGLKYTVAKLAMELDVFTAIAAGHGTLEGIAAAIGASQRGARILLDALCPLGLLTKSEGIYSLTPTAATFLVRGRPAYCGGAWLTLWRDRDRLAEAVRTGRATLDIPGPQAEELWADLTASDLVTWPRRVETARERWAQLGISAETRRGLRILDAACGSGVDSFVLAQADPAARVTALDLPKVLAIAAQVAEDMGVREQVTFCPGDLLEADLPDGEFDIVLFGAILYYFGPDKVTAVLRKARHVLAPDGLVVIRSIIADQDRCQDETALLMAVELLHDAAEGDVYTSSEYKAFLDAAGLADVTQHGNRLISARKRPEA
jgi:2-polyprenyl-3-methyl-5-hydroxy-6-metoxy-1,4-benzoquinol methylase